MPKKTSVKKASKSLVEKKSTPRKAAKKTETKKTKSKTKISDASMTLAKLVVEGMQEKKANNVKILDLRGISNRVCDIFVVCDAESTTHVNSIADSVSETVKKKTNEKPFHTEGWENSQWILIDYVNVVAHVFMRETREFYNIEGLWADAQISEI